MEPDTTQRGLADELSLGPVIYAHAESSWATLPHEPRVPGRPQMKPTPAQSTATIVGDQKELTPVTGTDLYAAFEQLTQNEPNPTMSRSTDLFERKVINTMKVAPGSQPAMDRIHSKKLPLISLKDRSHRSASEDSRPGTSHMVVEDNALGLQSLNTPQPLVSLYHDFETKDVTFNALDDISTPNIKYLPSNTHPAPGGCPPQTTVNSTSVVKATQVIKSASSTVRSATVGAWSIVRPLIVTQATQRGTGSTQSPSLIVSASCHSATTCTSIPNSASSSSHLTPGDATITGSMLGRAAQVLGRGSTEIKSPTDDNASQASAMVSTRRSAHVATIGKRPHMGSEEEEPNAPTRSKKNQSNTKSTERWK
ncbi:unnamed protein product [Rhizoctonia solani]|uniref:Uncharacterized protein n=1 Tax=Rhizoctonia solani TaxID=456999 RepID=A0A8H3GWM4_9AGAM|nr:unnamed protein product [Rhizoctonia solani]